MKKLIIPFLACLLWLGCGASQVEADAEHGFDHTVALSRCGQVARQAATDADNALPSDAGADAVKYVRRHAALDAFDRCVDQMKEGGI